MRLYLEPPNHPESSRRDEVRHRDVVWPKQVHPLSELVALGEELPAWLGHAALAWKLVEPAYNRLRRRDVPTGAHVVPAEADYASRHAASSSARATSRRTIAATVKPAAEGPYSSDSGAASASDTARSSYSCALARRSSAPSTARPLGVARLQLFKFPEEGGGDGVLPRHGFESRMGLLYVVKPKVKRPAHAGFFRAICRESAPYLTFSGLSMDAPLVRILPPCRPLVWVDSARAARSVAPYSPATWLGQRRDESPATWAGLVHRPPVLHTAFRARCGRAEVGNVDEVPALLVVVVGDRPVDASLAARAADEAVT